VSDPAGLSNIKQVRLVYYVSGIPNPVLMYDDGAHQDGMAGDAYMAAKFRPLRPALPPAITSKQ